ncbi:hypothetical protein RJG79_05725 [Mycoplasmatota bacterium WC44]
MKSKLTESFPREYFNRPKFVLYEDYLVIYNYKEIIDLRDESITVRNYSIVGKGLKIRSMNKHLMKITGDIISISRRDNE